MKKILSILIPTYNETPDMITRLLDSVKLQQNVDFDKIEVLLEHDGNEGTFDNSLFEGYPFHIEYEVMEKRGISARRNSLMRKAHGEYIQFADADDMWLNNIALSLTFREIENGGFDALWGNFLVEVIRPDNGKLDYHEQGVGGGIFVHNKVYKKSFMINNKIYFGENYPQRDVHEEFSVQTMCRTLSQNIKVNPMPMYLWKHNPKSVSRTSPYYIQETFKYLLMNSSYLAEKMYKLGKLQELREIVYSFICDCYYSLCSDKWLEECNKDYRSELEAYFKFYLDHYEKFANELTPDKKKQIEAGQKIQHTQMDGTTFESYTFQQWMKHIKEEVEPKEFVIKNKNSWE